MIPRHGSWKRRTGAIRRWSKEELKAIWRSAKKYYRKIVAQPDYVKRRFPFPGMDWTLRLRRQRSQRRILGSRPRRKVNREWKKGASGHVTCLDAHFLRKVHGIFAFFSLVSAILYLYYCAILRD